jgi:hypothetical protein
MTKFNREEVNYSLYRVMIRLNLIIQFKLTTPYPCHNLTGIPSSGFNLGPLHVKSQSPGVDLPMPFLYKSALHSFSLITVWLLIFWRKYISVKAAHKMLMKLTTGWVTSSPDEQRRLQSSLFYNSENKCLQSVVMIGSSQDNGCTVHRD